MTGSQFTHSWFHN